MPTRRFSSLVWISPALALGLVLGACTPGGQFDPTELLSSDVFTTKKKLAGDREPLFPNGVPGAETGVPPDLVKGYQPPPEQQAADKRIRASRAQARRDACSGKAETKTQAEADNRACTGPAQPAASAPHDPAWDRAPTPSAAQGPRRRLGRIRQRLRRKTIGQARRRQPTAPAVRRARQTAGRRPAADGQANRRRSRRNPAWPNPSTPGTYSR